MVENKDKYVEKELNLFGKNILKAFDSKDNLTANLYESALSRKFNGAFDVKDINQFRQLNKIVPTVILLDKRIDIELEGVQYSNSFYDLIVSAGVKGVMSEGGLNQTRIELKGNGILTSIYYGSERLGANNDGDGYSNEFLEHFKNSIEKSSDTREILNQHMLKVPVNVKGSYGTILMRRKSTNQVVYLTQDLEWYEKKKEELARQYQDNSADDFQQYKNNSKKYIIDKLKEKDKRVLKYADRINKKVEELVPYLSQYKLFVQEEEIISVKGLKLKVYSIESPDKNKVLLIYPNKVDVVIKNQRTNLKVCDVYNRMNKSFNNNYKSIKRYEAHLQFGDVNLSGFVKKILDSTKLR